MRDEETKAANVLQNENVNRTLISSPSSDLQLDDVTSP